MIRPHGHATTDPSPSHATIGQANSNTVTPASLSLLASVEIRYDILRAVCQFDSHSLCAFWVDRAFGLESLCSGFGETSFDGEIHTFYRAWRTESTAEFDVNQELERDGFERHRIQDKRKGDRLEVEVDATDISG